MKKSQLLILLPIVLLFETSCSTNYCEKCSEPGMTENHIEVMKICDYYEKNPEKICNECLIMILNGIVDVRTSTDIQFNGSSVYIRKIKALEKITGIETDLNIFSKPDALVIDKYLNWAKTEQGVNIKDLRLVYKGLNNFDLNDFILNLNKVNWSNEMLGKQVKSEAAK